MVSLSGSIISSTHYLIQLTGGNKGDALPLPDLVGSLTLDATSGKLALLDTTTKVGKYHDPRDDPNVGINVIDFVGYGSADASETAPAGSPSTTSSIQRSSLIDTDDNSADFIVGSYTPFNSAISVASYIMTAPDSPYDTGQCDMTFPIARNRVTSLTSSQLDYFKTSSETASAKLRYEAWATNQGVSDPYVAESIQPYALITFKDKVTAFSVYASVITLVSGYFLVKRKRLRQ